MNREIKFRAYDKDTNKMFYTDKGEIVVSFDVIGESVYLHEKPIELSNYDLMQYTGLKDKNDKEIYEGDIVRRNSNCQDLAQIKFGEFPVYEIETEEVIDKACGWYCEVITTDEFSNLAPFFYPSPLIKYWIDESEIEVIGNIYENKYLLKEVGNEG